MLDDISDKVVFGGRYLVAVFNDYFVAAGTELFLVVHLELARTAQVGFVLAVPELVVHLHLHNYDTVTVFTFVPCWITVPNNSRPEGSSFTLPVLRGFNKFQIELILEYIILILSEGIYK